VKNDLIVSASPNNSDVFVPTTTPFVESESQIPEKKEIGNCLKVVIVGPPHSGKSIAENFLRKLLPVDDTMRIAAQPDGEGDWTQNLYGENLDLAKELRNKGSFTPENVQAWKEQIKNTDKRFNLIDLGGVVSPENEELCEEANAMIIISSDENKNQEWIDLAKRKGLNIIALLHSTLEPQQEWFVKTPDKEWNNEGLVVGLERGKFNESETLKSLASYMLELVPEKAEKENREYRTIGVEEIAKMIGKEEEEILLPGREPMKGLNWKPSELKDVFNKLSEVGKDGGNFLIDGRAPQWLIVNIVKALRSNKVALADSKVEGGAVGISWLKEPEGEGHGDLPFQKTEDFRGGTLVEYAKDQFVIVDNKKLNEVIPPDVNRDKPVFLSGRTSNWVVAEIAMCYSTFVPAVYLYQPGTGFVCVATSSVDHELGSVIKANPE
jgi:hypothetical protein